MYKYVQINEVDELYILIHSTLVYLMIEGFEERTIIGIYEIDD